MRSAIPPIQPSIFCHPNHPPILYLRPLPTAYSLLPPLCSMRQAPCCLSIAYSLLLSAYCPLPPSKSSIPKESIHPSQSSTFQRNSSTHPFFIIHPSNHPFFAILIIQPSNHPFFAILIIQSSYIYAPLLLTAYLNSRHAPNALRSPPS